MMPKCGKKTLVYSRVVGYHNPVQNWNKGKGIGGEWTDRKTYSIGDKSSHICGCGQH